MIRLLVLTFCLMVPALAQAAYIAPALETTSPDDDFGAIFEGEEEGESGFVILARDTLFGETERRVESCVDFMQAQDEGFTDITQNGTPFFDDWLWVRCAALDQLRDAGPMSTNAPKPLTPALIDRLPALVSERAACTDKVAAAKAALRGETWLSFEGARQGKDTAFEWREQPPAQFDLIAGSDQESTVLAVSSATADSLRLHLNGATGAVERLAQFDQDGDGVDDMLVYVYWESAVFGAYRRALLWLKGAEPEAPYTLLLPQTALGETIAQCPDHISDVVAGPDALQK